MQEPIKHARTHARTHERTHTHTILSTVPVNVLGDTPFKNWRIWAEQTLLSGSTFLWWHHLAHLH